MNVVKDDDADDGVRDRDDDDDALGVTSLSAWTVVIDNADLSLTEHTRSIDTCSTCRQVTTTQHTTNLQPSASAAVIHNQTLDNE